MAELLKGKRIFYVEDDLSNRAIVQMIIEQEGAKLGFERWGRTDALIRLKAFMPVDVILMDLMLPSGISGYDVFDAIRADSHFAHVPIVAVSASDPTIELPKVRSKGFAGFISKPINLVHFPKQLLSVINGQLVWAADKRFYVS